MELKIENGIPIPPPYRKAGGLGDVLSEMKIGDSFTFPKAKRTSLATYFRSKAPKKFTSRSVDEWNVRVWRVA